MKNLLNDFTITANQTKNFFNILTQIIWIIIYAIPIVLIVYLIIKLILWIKNNFTYSNYSNIQHNQNNKTNLQNTNKKYQPKQHIKTQQEIFEEQARIIKKSILQKKPKSINVQQPKYNLKKKTITDNEKYFLDIIRKHFSKQYEIRPQVPLSNIIEKTKTFPREYQNELNRIIDIGIFDKDTTEPLLLIEINDSTHEQKRRKERDDKVKELCQNVELPLIFFWLKYSNTEQYIVEKISKKLTKN